MIILDTNVVSEPMKPHGDQAVFEWLNRQRRGSLYLTSVSLAELFFGIEIMPAGRRRDWLRQSVEALVRDEFHDRLLNFDAEAAMAFAPAAASARGRGLTVHVADGQIAAIALARGCKVATRDAAPFLAMGVQVIDPWRD